MTRRSRRHGDPEPVATPRAGEALRLDKWLWAARLFQTRALACAAVEGGQVRVNDERVKPARAVRPGDRLEIRRSGLVWELEVLGVDDHRGPARVAATLYHEDPACAAKRQAAIAERRAAAAAGSPGRPTKRDRRALEDFLSEP